MQANKYDKYFKGHKTFIKYLSDIVEVYSNIGYNNPNKKRKTLIVFDGMIPDMFSNKNLKPVVTELFIRGRRRQISIAFATQSNFIGPEKKRLSSTQYYIMKIHN